MPFSLIPHQVFDRYGDITVEYLREQNITLLLSDLDFTLAAKSTRRPDQALRDWIAALANWAFPIRAMPENPPPGAWRPPWTGPGQTGPIQPCWGTSC